MLAFAGPETLAIVLIVAIVVFGGAKIPDLARSLGRAKGEFKKGLDEGNPSSTPQPSPPDQKPSDQQPAS